MTCTILAHCTETGQLGLGVVSSLMAVTSRCAFVRAQVGAVAVQSMADPRLGPAALELVAAGYRPEAVLRAFARTEENFEYRQLALVNAQGQTAIHNGSRAIGPCAGCRRGRVCGRRQSPGRPQAADDHGHRLRARPWPARRPDHGGAAGGGSRGRHRPGPGGRAWWSPSTRHGRWRTCGSTGPRAIAVAELDHLWRLWRPQMRDYLGRALDPAATPEARERR